MSALRSTNSLPALARTYLHSKENRRHALETHDYQFISRPFRENTWIVGMYDKDLKHGAAMKDMAEEFVRVLKPYLEKYYVLMPGDTPVYMYFQRRVRDAMRAQRHGRGALLFKEAGLFEAVVSYIGPLHMSLNFQELFV
jgi:hypothetical protein